MLKGSHIKSREKEEGGVQSQAQGEWHRRVGETIELPPNTRKFAKDQGGMTVRAETKVGAAHCASGAGSIARGRGKKNSISFAVPEKKKVWTWDPW